MCEPPHYQKQMPFHTLISLTYYLLRVAIKKNVYSPKSKSPTTKWTEAKTTVTFTEPLKHPLFVSGEKQNPLVFFIQPKANHVRGVLKAASTRAPSPVTSDNGTGVGLPLTRSPPPTAAYPHFSRRKSAYIHTKYPNGSLRRRRAAVLSRCCHLTIFCLP